VNDFNAISFTVAEGKDVEKEGKYWKLPARASMRSGSLPRVGETPSRSATTARRMVGRRTGAWSW
jgi:hypothetical protein